MSTTKDMDGFLAFLAGAGTGVALARLLPGNAWVLGGSPRGARELDPYRQNNMSASIGRLHSLLGEIRGLMRAREATRRPGGGDPGSGNEPRRPSAAESPRRNKPPDDSWRRPDQIGYGPVGSAAGMRPSGDRTGMLAVLAWAAVLAAGMTAVMVSTRRGAPGAVWPALGGFLAAAALVAWRRGVAAGAGGRSGATVTAMPGLRGMRKGRPAIP